MVDPYIAGGFNNLEFGFAEYAEGDAERTFKACKKYRTYAFPLILTVTWVTQSQFHAY